MKIYVAEKAINLKKFSERCCHAYLKFIPSRYCCSIVIKSCVQLMVYSSGDDMHLYINM